MSYVYPLSHAEYDNSKIRYVPNENPDFDYKQTQFIHIDEPTPVVNAAAGEVMYVGYYNDYGMTTVVRHDGFSTMYYNLNPDGFYNNVGVKLPAGYLIGETGTSGQTMECGLGYLYSDDEDYYLQITNAAE